MNKFNIDKEWKEHELHISNEYGFSQISISSFIKSSKYILLEKGFTKILDLGCGSGKHSIYLNKLGFEVCASDIDCKFSIENINRLNLDNIKVSEHSFTSIPYDNEFFDVVICMSTLHHAVIGDIKKGIDEAFRILKPGGHFIFDFLSKEDESYGLGEMIEDNTFIGGREGEESIPHHYTDVDELKALMNKFFSVEVNKSIYKFNIAPKEHTSKCFDVVAIK